MKKILIGLLILGNMTAHATEFKILCAGALLNQRESIPSQISKSLNSEIKQFGDRVIDVTVPVSNTFTNYQTTCVTVKLKSNI